jgi:hypothetical protein
MDDGHLIVMIVLSIPLTQDPKFLPVLMLAPYNRGRKRRGIHELSVLDQGKLNMTVRMMGWQTLFRRSFL